MYSKREYLLTGAYFALPGIGQLLACMSMILIRMIKLSANMNMHQIRSVRCLETAYSDSKYSRARIRKRCGAATAGYIRKDHSLDNAYTFLSNPEEGK